MTIPGQGGQVPPRPDQQYLTGQQGVPMAPGGQPVLRVTEIIVTPGSVLEGIFTYSSGPPAAGTLIESASVATAGVDAYGNHYLAGHATYQAGFATSLNGGFVAFYTGSLAAGWTFQGQLEVAAGGALVIDFPSIEGAINVPQPSPGGTLSQITQPTPSSFSSGWFANVDGVVNAMVNQMNTLVQTTLPTAGVT